MLLALAQTFRALYPWGDHAIVEGETMRAWSGEQLLGTYSRYGWHHPGPALFYWMAPWHALFGDSPAALNAAVAFLNLAAVTAIVLIVRRRAGRAAAYGAAALALLYIAQEGPSFVRDFWIPHSVVFPFAALIVLTAAAAAGTIELVPLVALCASFLAETDLSVAPASAAVLVAGVVFFVATRGWRGRRWDRRVAIVAGVTVLVSVVVWYPPLHQQLTAHPGNVTQLRDFFKTPDPGHTLSEGLSSVANANWVLVAGGHTAADAVPASGAAKAFLILTLALLVAGLVLGLRRGRRFAAALCVVALLGLLGEVYAVTKIRGELLTYLVEWSGSATFVAWTGVACALWPERGVRARMLVPAVAAAAALLAVWNVVDQATHASLSANDAAYSNPAQKPIDLAVRSWTAKHGVKKVLISIPQNSAWPLAAGVYIDRVRRGNPLAIAPDWIGVFGDKFAPKGNEDGQLVFADAAQPPPALPAGAKPIVKAGGVVVYGAVAAHT